MPRLRHVGRAPPRPRTHPGLEPFLFAPFDTFLYAVDILGYSFMSVATLFAAGVFAGGGLERTARGFLVANGLLLPFIALQKCFHPLIWGASLWTVTFPRIDVDDRSDISTRRAGSAAAHE